MAFLFATGLEKQDLVTFGELDFITNSPTISTSIFRSGAASMVSNVSSTTAYATKTVAASPHSVGIFARESFYIDTTPGGNTIIMLGRNSGGTNIVHIVLTASRTLALFDTVTATQIGSDSAALDEDTHYVVELHCTNSGAGSTATAYINGTSFASGTLDSAATVNEYRFGVSNSSTCVIYFDDIIVYDESGTAFNTQLPVGVKLAYLLPNGAGDTNESDGDYTDVDDVTPDGGTTIATLATNNDILDVAVQSSSDVGIGSSDIIHAIAVCVNEAAATAAQESWKVRLKSASGGTTSESATTTHDDVTYKTNGDGAPRVPKLVSYTDPTTTSAWTPTGTNSIDNMQIGIQAVDANPDINVTALWAIVVYEPVEAPTELVQDFIMAGIIPFPREVAK